MFEIYHFKRSRFVYVVHKAVYYYMEDLVMRDCDDVHLATSTFNSKLDPRKEFLEHANREGAKPFTPLQKVTNSKLVKFIEKKLIERLGENFVWNSTMIIVHMLCIWFIKD